MLHCVVLIQQLEDELEDGLADGLEDGLECCINTTKVKPTEKPGECCKNTTKNSQITRNI